jgi:hypothetical protein
MTQSDDLFDDGAFVDTVIDATLDVYCPNPIQQSPLLLHRDLPMDPDILPSPSPYSPDEHADSVLALVVQSAVDDFCAGFPPSLSSAAPESFPSACIDPIPTFSAPESPTREISPDPGEDFPRAASDAIDGESSRAAQSGSQPPASGAPQGSFPPSQRPELEATEEVVDRAVTDAIDEYLNLLQ